MSLHARLFILVGEMGSGKGTVAKLLSERHGAAVVRYSTPLRDILTRLYLPHERPVLSALSLALRTAFGEDIIKKTVLSDIKDRPNSQLIVLDGARRLDDITGLIDEAGTVVVHVSAPLEVRASRLSGRLENVDDKHQTKSVVEENSLLETEETIKDILPYCSEIIDNSGSLEELQALVANLVKKYENIHQKA